MLDEMDTAAFTDPPLGRRGGDIGRLDAPSMSASVARRLRADILSGHFRPGAKLPMKVLTDRYGASVVPVREALALLAGAGLISLECQRGFRVVPASREDFLDIVGNRKRLECMALALAVEHGDEHWRAALRAAQGALGGLSHKLGDPDPITRDWEVAHRRFHLALIAGCGSPMLIGFCRQLHDRYDRYRRLAIPSASFMAGLSADHDEILEAALDHDASRAVALMDRHIAEMTGIILDEYWSPHGPDGD